ncbi:hypothetical protein P8452_71420 [Trifolium repens]|nr:hypothetical protein P8452_71420 [Trifolium repens]
MSGSSMSSSSISGSSISVASLSHDYRHNKAASHVVELDSDRSFDDTDGGDGFEADEFVKDLIVTPTMTCGKAKAEVLCRGCGV